MNQDIQSLLASLEEAKRKVYEIQESIRTYQDGYIYHVLILSYGSQSWSIHYNSHSVQEILDEYGDGYDGLVEVYTDNPKPKLQDYGCLRDVCTLEELPESRQEISKSAGFVNLISRLKS